MYVANPLLADEKTVFDHELGISNFGRDIVQSSPPNEIMRVAYFESWNANRECLTMDVDQINTDKYTHIHFAFANIISTFGIDISGV